MADEKRWVITDIIIPSASWELSKSMMQSYLSFDSDFKLTLNDSEEKIDSAKLSIRLDFLDVNDTEKLLGFISISCLATIDSGYTFNDFKAKELLNKEFIEDLISVLIGSCRSEVQRIASFAGLVAPVILPSLRIEGEQIKIETKVGNLTSRDSIG